jgi:hypothetical protein
MNFKYTGQCDNGGSFSCDNFAKTKINVERRNTNFNIDRIIWLA